MQWIDSASGNWRLVSKDSVAIKTIVDMAIVDMAIVLRGVAMVIVAIIFAAACGLSSPAAAGDYASEISAYRHAHGLSSVKLDGQLNAVALQQAQAMASSGTVSHTVGGLFSVRVAKLRKKLAAENIAAGFMTFPETLKQWEDSAGHRENLLIPGAQKVGVASAPNPKSPYRMFWAMVITD